MVIIKDNIESLMSEMQYEFVDKDEFPDPQSNRLYNYWCFLEEYRSQLTDIKKIPLEIVLYSKYYWFSRLVERCREVSDRRDGGMEDWQSRILYEINDTAKDKVKRVLSQTEDQEILYMYAYHYNWDDGFEIPQAILDNGKCDLSIALLLFYEADGFRFLMEKSDNVNSPQWSSFVRDLYDSIMAGKYRKGKIAFEVPLSKVQVYKLKKMLTEEEKIFTENIDGKCLDTYL